MLSDVAEKELAEAKAEEREAIRFFYEGTSVSYIVASFPSERSLKATQFLVFKRVEYRMIPINRTICNIMQYYINIM